MTLAGVQKEMTTASILDSTRRAYANGFAELQEDKTTGHKCLVTTQPFKPGDVLCSFSARETFPEATYLTIQIGVKKHITLQPDFLQYTNHSCAPNIFFDTTNMVVICVQEIRAGEELTYFYPSTEWEMAQPFPCHCGAGNCLRQIKGAAYFAAEVLQQYRLSAFIRQQIIRTSR